MLLVYWTLTLKKQSEKKTNEPIKTFTTNLRGTDDAIIIIYMTTKAVSPI